MEKLILLVSEYLCLYQMELPEYHNIVMKIMLGETFHSRCVCHITSADIPYHSNHSISTEKNKNTLPSQALTAGRFQLALVDTWPDCCYLQLHIRGLLPDLSPTGHEILSCFGSGSD